MTDKASKDIQNEKTGGGQKKVPKMPKRATHPDASVSPIIPIGNYKECGDCSAMVLDQFAKSFDKSAKRWELIVYPSMFAFIVLAMYGFFLIYSLTKDIRTMATSIDPRMGANMGGMSMNIRALSDNVELISTHLEYISDNMETMSVDMQAMSQNIDAMTSDVSDMTQKINLVSENMGTMTGVMQKMSVKLNTLEPMSQNVASMTQAMHVMTGSVNRMGYDMNSATRPMSFMTHFMPW